VEKATVNGVEIAYSEVGSGFPLVWCHEFGGSMESWDHQVKYFSQRYRVITYNARGYPPSSVPGTPEAYSQDIAVNDLYGLLRHLGIDQAHIGGLSMGGSTTLLFGVRHPEMCRSLIVAAAGSGSTDPDEFRQTWRSLAERLRSQGTAALADYASGPTRLQLKRKNPEEWQVFYDLLMRHSAEGSAFTMLGVQVGRPPLFVWEPELTDLQVPTLVLVGDEDTPCIEPALFMKRTIPNCGLGVLPQSGHAINLEEPELFNRLCTDFLSAAEAGNWTG
jgi:pimeloyl-ACP methyl ester carboxylesterase